MLSVTETAAGYLTQLLEKAPDDAVVRFVPQPEGLILQFGTEQPGDTTFSHEDKTILALDAPVAEALTNKTLDVKATEKGAELALV